MTPALAYLSKQDIIRKAALVAELKAAERDLIEAHRKASNAYANALAGAVDAYNGILEKAERFQADVIADLESSLMAQSALDHDVAWCNWFKAWAQAELFEADYIPPPRLRDVLYVSNADTLESLPDQPA